MYYNIFKLFGLPRINNNILDPKNILLYTEQVLTRAGTQFFYTTFIFHCLYKNVQMSQNSNNAVIF